MDIQAKRKDIIKNITIIFLIIMLVLTFFSSTIMNRSLPEVAAQYAFSGQITTSVRATGTTTANENYQVILEEGRVIHSVNVRRGDKVQEGDLLFTLEEGDSTELQEAQEALAKAELDYENWKLKTTTDIANAERDIRYKTEDLTKIKNRGIMSTLNTSEQEKAIKELEKLLGSYQRALALLDVEDAEIEMNNKLAAIAAAEEAIKAAEDISKTAEAAIQTAEDAIDAAEGEIDAAQTDVKNAEKAYKAAGSVYEDKSAAYNELRQNITDNSTEQLEQQLLTANRGIEDQTIELQRLQKNFDDKQKELDALKEKHKSLKRILETAESIYNGTIGDEVIIQSNIASYQGTITRLSALPELTEEETIELANARGNLSYYQSLLSAIASEQSNAMQEFNEAKSNYTANENAIKQAEEQIASMTLTLEDKTRTLSRAESDRDAIIKKIEYIQSLPTKEEQQALLDEAKKHMDNAEIARDLAQDAHAESQETYNDKVAAKTKAEANYQDVLADYQDTLTDCQEAKAEYQAAEAEYEAAKAAYEAAQTAYKTTKKNAHALDAVYPRDQLETMIENTELELKLSREALEDLKNNAGGNTDGYANYNAYVEAITAQQRSIETLKNDLARSREENALEEPTYTAAIARAKQTVERISETAGSNEIYAKVSGTINSISVTAGQEIKAQTVLAEIEKSSQGYSVELSMTTEQAKRIAVGQAATILYYWGTTPEAVVESIKPSQSDPQNTRIVTLVLNGDITAGQSFTFSLGERSANYDNVVPSSAIREDSNGKFVLVVEAKNTPIGNRYTAVRRDVEVIAEDDTNTAVTGLTGGEFVITTSQTPISAGQQVRLSDN